MNKRLEKKMLPIAGFALCSGKQDLGGPTTWLENFIEGTLLDPERLSLLIQYYSNGPHDPYTNSYLYRSVLNRGVCISGTNIQPFVEDAALDCLRYLNQSRPRVFLPQCRVELNYAAMYAEKYGLPWIYTLHADHAEFWAMGEIASPKRGKGVWVAVSKQIGEQARDRFPDADVRTIPYGTKIPVERAEFASERFTVAYVGRLQEEQKCISVVFNALIDACKRDVKVRAKIVGDGEARTRLEAMCRDAGLEHRIQFVGRIDAADVQRTLADCQATLLMSDYEGLPISLLEAMACGLVPIVRGIQSGIPELVVADQTGIVVSNHPEDAANAIATLANDPARWAVLSVGARGHVSRHYSVTLSNQKWDQLILELADKSRVTYPITVPKSLKLPPRQAVLARMDNRRPVPATWHRRLARYLRSSMKAAARALE